MEVLVDFSHKLGEARDQGRRGTCLVFAATAAHEHLHKLQDPLCIEWLYYHAVNIDNVPLGSWTTVGAIVLALKDYGQPYEAVWKYQSLTNFEDWYPPTNPVPLFYAQSIVGAFDWDTVVDTLKLESPVVITFETTNEFKHPNQVGGVSMVENDPLLRKLGLHAAVAVGYGIFNQRKYVKILNSYGTDWGNQGCAWVSEDYLLANADSILQLRKLERTTV